MRLLRDGAVQLGYQVRLGHWMAELLEANRTPEYRHADRPLTLHGTHRGAVCALRCASWARLRRRPAADGATLLHELGGVAVRADRRGAQVIAASKKESHVEPLRGSTPPAIKRCGLRPLNTRGKCESFQRASPFWIGSACSSLGDPTGKVNSSARLA